jgi:hypothetical protein
MVRCRVFPPVVNAALMAVLCVPILAQVPPDQTPDQASEATVNGKIVPPHVEPKPFAITPSKRIPANSIEFRPADQMTESDRLLVADSEASITEHAAFSGFDFDKTNWNYQQVVCPALPNHLFLQFMRDNGVGDVTVFSASIPRAGEGRVRIVPVLRRGYSLWSPAPISAMTISAFNHIRAEESGAEESPEGDSDWMGNGLCYAALAGAHPQIASPDEMPVVHKPVPALAAIMDVNTADKNEEVIKFADAAALPRPMRWTMTFTRQGKLIKATHSLAPIATANPVPDTSPVAKTWQVPPQQ